MKRTVRAAACAAVVLTALAAVLTGCGGSGAQKDAAGVINVRERDFQISISRTHVDAGEVVFRARNVGPDAHELIVVREPGSRLPLRRDGSTVSEEKLDRVTAGALEPGQPGSSRKLRLHLAPGRYVLFCNMSGHYLGGMHTELVVG